jgi:cyclic pyranopterin phosphate synthase
MSERFVIPIAEHRYQVVPAPVPAAPADPTGELTDRLGRRLHDVRISVTDRCNFRCGYCMPRSVFDKDYAFLPQSSLLNFEEIVRLVRAFVAHGTEKIRLTGGEPLLRKDIERLIGMLAEVRTRSGRALDLTLTTNASLLSRKAQSLRDAGLSRLTVSLDALDEARFQAMNDADFPVSEVLDGLEAARRAGFTGIKVNMVVQRGRNDDQILPMARHFRGLLNSWMWAPRMGGRCPRSCPAPRYETGFMQSFPSNRFSPTTPVKSPSAGAIRMVQAKSASSLP